MVVVNMHGQPYTKYTITETNIGTLKNCSKLCAIKFSVLPILR